MPGVNPAEIIQPFSLVEKWFLHSSKDIFIEDENSTITIDDAWRHATQLAGILRSKGVRPGDTIALHLPTSLNILFVMAAFHEAAITLPYTPGGIGTNGLKVDWLISNTKKSAEGAEKTIFVDSELMRSAQMEPHTLKPRRYENDDSICRIAFTSGSTGVPKPVAFTIKMLHQRATTALNLWMSEPPFMSLLDLGAASGFHTFYASLIGQRTYFVPGNAPHNATQIERHKIRSIKASPIQIAELMNVLISQPRTAQNLEIIYSAGSLLPTKVAHIVRETTPAKIYNLFGSTEAGTATARKNDFGSPEDMGAITNGTEIQIVDENDLELPTNEIGIVRYRTTAQPENYFNQSPNEISAFRNGWFYSGDRGLINDEGHLILHGRESEIINAGGIKIDPAKIDSVALTVHGVKDACAFAVEGKLGITEIALALVLEDGFDRKNFIETLTQNLGKLIPSIIIQVQEIPRTHSGKPLRGELADFYLDTQKRK